MPVRSRKKELSLTRCSHTQHTIKKQHKDASLHLQAAAIHDEESPTMGEVSDVINDDTTVVDDDMSNDDNDEGMAPCFFVPPGTS